jgi:hypothetical protein
MQAQARIERRRTRKPGERSRRSHRREPGTALRWGVVLALVIMLATLGWAVHHGERAGDQNRPVSAVSGLTVGR